MTISTLYPSTMPTLTLNFLNSTPLDPRITFTRASIGTYFDPDGLLKTAASSVPRFDYDPATFAPRGLLIEEARTNLLLQSRDMTQAAWAKNDVTATRNQVGLDGVANTACLMTEGSAGTALTTQTSTVTAGSAITNSNVFKRGNTDWVLLYATDTSFANGGRAWFNLNTGAKGAVQAVGTGTSVSSTMTSLGGGWYRCSVTATPDGTYTVAKSTFFSASADLSSTRVAGATYTVDCAQLEVGAFATSIIPTTTATVARLADNASMTGTNFSSWYNASAGTLVAEASQPFIFSASKSAASLSSSVTNRITLYRQAGGNINGFVQPPGLAITTSRPASAGIPWKSAIGYDSTTAYFTTGGNSVVTQAHTVTLSSVNSLSIGNSDATPGSEYWNGYIRSLTYYPTRLPNAQLQALTTS